MAKNDPRAKGREQQQTTSPQPPAPAPVPDTAGRTAKTRSEAAPIENLRQGSAEAKPANTPPTPVAESIPRKPKVAEAISQVTPERREAVSAPTQSVSEDTREAKHKRANNDPRAKKAATRSTTAPDEIPQNQSDVNND